MTFDQKGRTTGRGNKMDTKELLNNFNLNQPTTTIGMDVDADELYNLWVLDSADGWDDTPPAFDVETTPHIKLVSLKMAGLFVHAIYEHGDRPAYRIEHIWCHRQVGPGIGLWGLVGVGIWRLVTTGRDFDENWQWQRADLVCTEGADQYFS